MRTRSGVTNLTARPISSDQLTALVRGTAIAIPGKDNAGAPVEVQVGRHAVYAQVVRRGGEVTVSLTRVTHGAAPMNTRTKAPTRPPARAKTPTNGPRAKTPTNGPRAKTPTNGPRTTTRARGSTTPPRTRTLDTPEALRPPATPESDDDFELGAPIMPIPDEVHVDLNAATAPPTQNVFDLQLDDSASIELGDALREPTNKPRGFAPGTAEVQERARPSPFATTLPVAPAPVAPAPAAAPVPPAFVASSAEAPKASGAFAPLLQ